LIKKQASLGFALKRDEVTEDHLSYEDMRKKLTETLKRAFRPEFINRVDNVIVFRSLSRDNIQKIVKLELAKVALRLVDHRITIEASPAALTLLGEQGYDPDMGARPLRRVIQLKVEDQLSDNLLSGAFVDGDHIQVDVNPDGDVILTRAEALLPAAEPAPEPSI
jgi:ATP-dependent Clp protease ATP-binding subunit ClpC